LRVTVLHNITRQLKSVEQGAKDPLLTLSLSFLSPLFGPYCFPPLHYEHYTKWANKKKPLHRNRKIDIVLKLDLHPLPFSSKVKDPSHFSSFPNVKGLFLTRNDSVMLINVLPSTSSFFSSSSFACQKVLSWRSFISASPTVRTRRPGRNSSTRPPASCSCSSFPWLSSSSPIPAPSSNLEVGR